MAMTKPIPYEITLRGRASARLLRPLIDDFTISHATEGVTSLTGCIRDQSHLHGVLAHLTSVNVEIMSINPHKPVTGPLATNSNTPSQGVRPRHAALAAGVSYLGLFVLGLFANFFVLDGLIEPGDATATVTNIRESEGLFRAGLVGFLAIFVLDVVIAWALHIIFRPINRELSLLTAWFRLIYTTLLGVATLFLFLALEVISGANYLTAFTPDQLNAQAMAYLDAFNVTWLIGLLMFGIHLLLLGYMVLKSGTINRALGYVLMLAGAGYIIDTGSNALLGSYDDYETLFLLIVAIPSVIGEFAVGLWLLLRAGKEPAEHTSQGAS